MYWAEALDASKESWTWAEIDRRELMETLYQREAVSLVRLARIFTDDRNAAEDLVQEAFIRLFNSAHRIQDEARVSAYLRSIVLNLARDHNRRGLMSLRHQDVMTDRWVPQQPDEEVVRTESQASVLAALRSLSPRQRDCLVLRFYLELSEGEIATTLDISPNSVKTHCRRGLAAMASRLEGAP
ncbi:MAG TPA: sigma-70 family RNA polymerase sigma factor [Acidimicrobiia bacterium]|nr:sigma-70 family RNA polymerase sigma factor [Acidimicrobiia bacterium]